jgi:hypothetical protein
MPLQYFRSFGRQATALNAVLSSLDGTWERRARVLNLGIGGGCVSVAEELPVGARVQLRIDVPHRWEPLAVHARISWSGRPDPRQFRAGLEFDQHSTATVRGLIELLGTGAFE